MAVFRVEKNSGYTVMSNHHLRNRALSLKAKVKGLYFEKTGKTYDATVLLADTGGKYVNYRVERKE